MQPFRAKKSLGQNFLTNPTIAEKIAKAGHITPGEVVLEIGPGTGMLTRALLNEGASVVAMEADARAIATLNETFPKEIESGTLTLRHADIRTTALTDLPLPRRFSVIANIPYYLSGMLFACMLEAQAQPHTIVFLVQKEVAERVARSTKESILSLSIKAYGTPRYGGTVSRGNFSPQPGVDSAILAITDISKKRFHSVSEQHFFKVLKQGFSARRKHLLGNLTALAPREDLIRSFEALGIPLDARGEDLGIDTWIALASHIPH